MTRQQADPVKSRGPALDLRRTGGDLGARGPAVKTSTFSRFDPLRRRAAGAGLAGTRLASLAPRSAGPMKALQFLRGEPHETRAGRGSKKFRNSLGGPEEFFGPIAILAIFEI